MRLSSRFRFDPPISGSFRIEHPNVVLGGEARALVYDDEGNLIREVIGDEPWYEVDMELRRVQLHRAHGPQASPR